MILPYLALVVAHLIWGANFIVAKLTLQEIPVMALAFIRFAFASLLLLPFLLLEKKKPKIKVSDLPRLLVIGITMVTLNIALFYEGITRTSATTASILTLIIPVFSVLAGWIILKERLYVINLIGVASGLMGAIFIIGVPSLVVGNIDAKTFMGNTLILLASISWVIGMIVSRQMLKKYSSLEITSVAFLTGVITFLIPAIYEYLQNPHWPNQVSLLGLLGLFFITVLSSICAYFLIEWGISYIPVSRANIFQYIEPLVATTLGVLVLGEAIGISFIVGSILIGLGVYLGTLGSFDYHRTHKAHRR